MSKDSIFFTSTSFQKLQAKNYSIHLITKTIKNAWLTQDDFSVQEGILSLKDVYTFSILEYGI